MRSSRVLAALPFLAITFIGGSTAAASTCADVEGFQKLDFWLGDWDVYVGEEKVGTNRIEKILEGCALLEHWTDADGNEGKSLFFYVSATDTWKQVWVTERATARGGVKEKTLVASFDDGGVRFRGDVPLEGGGTYLDRTTLTPLPDGNVRQHIEISGDGESWRSMFDAVYKRKGRREAR